MYRLQQFAALRSNRALPQLNSHVVARRLLMVAPTIVFIVLMGFLLVHLAPGDPVAALAGENGDASYYAFMRQRFGLDRPLLEQLVTYFGRVASGDMGTSYLQGRSTVALIFERVPATLLLTGSALLISIVVSVPLAALAARRPYGARDIGISAAVLVLYSAPAFWIAQVAILVAALKIGLVPVQGMTSAGSTQTGAARWLDIAWHLALPALVLASQEIAVLVRLTRAGLVDELGRDHIRTARAKGLTEARVLFRHAMPRALLPVVTVVGARAGQLIAGAVIVEIVFGWPGVGRLLLTAIQTRDTPLLLALFMIISFAVVMANLVTDLAYGVLDSRVRVR